MLVLAGCGGGAPKYGSRRDYTRVTNDVAGKVQKIADDISATAASGARADDAAAWKALADRLHAALAELRAVRAPTRESKAPLATLVRDLAAFESDVRKVGDAGGVDAADTATLTALSNDGSAITDDFTRLPLY